MVYRTSPEGGYGVGATTDHVDAFDTGRIDILDAELLFRGHFARSGPDLVLTGQDGHRLVVTGYFVSEKHPDLVAPNGAHLTGDVVDMLAGSPTHGQYAQAGTTLPPEAIGKVEKAVGQVTLIHNGVAGPLHVGDPVYKTDVVQTGPNSSCGIGFPDGTALDLVNNTRMALNEYNYQGDSASNGALFSLVEGTFAFVAGKVAHTGEGMKINTPVATMGIRGTVGLFRSEPTVVNANLGHVWSAFLHEDIDGSHHLGRIALIDQDPSSPTFGETIYLLDSSDYIAYLEPQGPGHPPHVRLEPITSSKTFENRHFFDDLGTIINSYNNANPQAPGNPGSGDNPSDLFQRELFQDNGNAPLFKFAELNDSADSNDAFRSDLPFIPVMAGLPETNFTPSSVESSTVFIWNGIGAWPTALANWSGGAAPSSPNDSVIIQTGTATYNLPNIAVSSLTIASGAVLDVVGGQLTTAGLIDNGTINVDGDPPVFIVTGSAIIGSGATLTAQDGSVIFTSGGLLNAGTLTAEAGGALLINESGINSGIIQAIDGGVVTIKNGTIVNAAADGQGNMTDGVVFVGDQSRLALDNAALLNGIVHVGARGEIDTTSGTRNAVNASLTVDKCGFIVVSDNSSLALASPRGIDNNGTIELGSSGHATVLYFDQSHAILAGSGTIVLEGGSGSQDIIAGLPSQGVTTVNLDNRGNTIEGAGAIGQNDGALSFTNDGCGVIDADLSGQTLVVETGNTFTNNALLEASNGGILDVLDNVVGHGWVAISGGGVAVFAGAFSQNVGFSGAGTLELAHSLGGAYCGTITGFGAGDALVLDDLAYSSCEYAVWCNGVLTIYDGRTVETIKMAGDFSHDSFAIVDDGGKAEVVFAYDEWIGPSPEGRTGTWQTDANWSSGLPTAKLNVIVDLPGAYTITTSGDHAAEALVITDPDATLTGAGSLAFGTLENQGTIKTPAGERLVINVRNGGTNSGTIAADGGSIAVHASIDNREGLIVALGFAASIILADTAIAGGKIEALHDGVVDLDHATITDSMIETACGGFVQTVSGNSTLRDVTIARGGDIVVNQDSSLTLVGDLHNGGAIVVGTPHFDSGADLIIKGSVALDGPGSIVLNAGDAAIVGSYEGGTLGNDNTIFGAGHIGNGAENFHLVNENCGTIDANSCAQALVLDTGCNQVVNSGTLAADNGGVLDVKSAVDNAGGSIKISDGGFAEFEKDVAGGTALIQGGHLQFDAASSVDVAFDNGGGHYGELLLGDVKDFAGTIAGFDGQHSVCPSLSTSDEIDLLGVKGCDVCFSAGANGDAIITIMKDAHTVLATLTIDKFDFRDLEKESDGHGGTIIIDQPGAAVSNPSVSIGGAENDSFVFHFGEPAKSPGSANPQNRAADDHHFAHGHDVEELTAAVTPDSLHGHGVGDVDHVHGGAVAGMGSALLHQNLQHLTNFHG
jgi:FecR protein